MDTSKLLDAAAELEAEAARCLDVAKEIRTLAKRHANGTDHPVIQPRPKPVAPIAAPVASTATTSQLVIAVDVLRQVDLPLHVNDLVPLVAERRPGMETTRATVESALVRGMQGRFKGVIRRTAPGTFEVAKKLDIFQ